MYSSNNDIQASKENYIYTEIPYVRTKERIMELFLFYVISLT